MQEKSWGRGGQKEDNIILGSSVSCVLPPDNIIVIPDSSAEACTLVTLKVSGLFINGLIYMLPPAKETL